jgi:hypothetical protein
VKELLDETCTPDDLALANEKAINAFSFELFMWQITGDSKSKVGDF